MSKENGSEYVIALDLGKKFTKAIGRKKEGTKEDIRYIKFRTKMLELQNTDVEVGDNSYYLTINGKNIIVGEQGKEAEENFLTTKNSDLHKYCAYNAIVQFLEPNTTDNKMQIALACPLPVVQIKEAKEIYKSMIKGNGVQKINVDGENYEFEITDIVIKSEDSCVVYVDELFKEDELGIIGFGGLNMNFLLYKNGDFIYRQAFEHGAIKLIKYIADDLTVYKDGNIVDESTAEKALYDGYITFKGKKDDKSVEVIESSKKRFFTEAKNLILQDGHNIDNLKKLAFIGGTSSPLEKIITKEYPNASIFNDPQWVSIEGLYKVAVKKYMK